MIIDKTITPASLEKKLVELWELSGSKIINIRDNYDAAKGSPVFTVGGKYTTMGWTEWTQGFLFGSSVLQYDAVNQDEFLEYGRKNTLELMAPHLTHMGVHDHGFNNLSTYGNLLRLMLEGKIQNDEWEKNFYELALKISSAVQAARWSEIPGGGYIYSFNGPHSLFIDTLRSCRILAVGYQMGHSFMGEGDKKINLLERMVKHILTTAKYSVYYGEGRDFWDINGRTAHECVFNPNDGAFRCPNSQQGYTGFTTWTRGQAWAIAGFPEQLEFFETLTDKDLEGIGNKADIVAVMLKAAKATCDFWIYQTPTCGIPYWDTGAPGLVHMGDYLNKPADPYNDYEPVDSSAAAIAAQGFLRLGKYLSDKGQKAEGEKYTQAALTMVNNLFDDPYLSKDPGHQGLLLHSIYHRPNDWDHTPKGSKIPNGESSMWGDYHAREVAIYLWRIIKGEPYHQFFFNEYCRE